MTLALLFSNHLSGDTHDGDYIKKYSPRPPAPSGMHYYDERPPYLDEKPKKVVKLRAPKRAKKLLLPIEYEDIESMAQIFKEQMYPYALFNILDSSTFQFPLDTFDIMQASLEAEKLLQVLQNEQQKQRLKSLLEALVRETKAFQQEDDEVLLTLLLARKKSL